MYLEYPQASHITFTCRICQCTSNILLLVGAVDVSALLRRAGIEANEHLIWRMRRRLGHLVIQAELLNNHELAVQILKEVVALPQTETTAELTVQGYTLNGPFNGQEKLTICYKAEPDRHLTHHVLKVLSDTEWRRAISFKEALGTLTHAGVTTFTLHQSASDKKMMIMPYHISTLESVVSLEETYLNQLWDEMSSAVSFIHSLGFAHMDIKSSNICLNQNGRYVLIDLGSVAPLGMKSSPTMCYLPSDMQPAYESSLVAHPNIDWWMLAMVIAEKGGKAQPGRGRRGSEPTTERLKSLLPEHILGDLLERIVR